MVVALHQGNRNPAEGVGSPLPPYVGLRGMVCESVGPVAHEVSVPFHDSQVRGVAMLIETGWDQFWGTADYLQPGPFLAEHLIFRMVRSSVKLVAVDFPIIAGSSETRLITTGKIPIVENLRNLRTLPRIGFRFSLVPLGPEANGIRAVNAYADIV